MTFDKGMGALGLAEMLRRGILIEVEPGRYRLGTWQETREAEELQRAINEGRPPVVDGVGQVPVDPSLRF